MAAENKGHVKVTLDVEINGALMDMMKECIENTASTGSGDVRTQEKERLNQHFGPDHKTWVQGP